MKLQSKFIYHVTTAAAYYVVIADSVKCAEDTVPGIVENVTKLGCVTADVHYSTESGIVIREWRMIE